MLMLVVYCGTVWWRNTNGIGYVGRRPNGFGRARNDEGDLRCVLVLAGETRDSQVLKVEVVCGGFI